MIERLLRAGAAIVAGLWIAVDHLVDRPANEPLPPRHVEHPCPACGHSLTEGPHIHDDIVVWATEHDGAVLLTELDGSHPSVFSETRP